MPEQGPFKLVFYIAATPEKVWDGLVSKESNRTLFMGADLETDLTPGGPMNWVGTGKDGQRVEFVHGKVIRADPPKFLQYTWAMGPSTTYSRVTIELVPESEATQVTLTHDQWGSDTKTAAAAADGWARILSRLKTLLETGKTFKPH